MAEENQNVVEETNNANSSQQNASQAQNDNNNKVEFSEIQQAKVNSLIKEEKAKILSKLGVENLESASSLIAEGKKSSEYQEQIKKFTEENATLQELKIENALIKNNIAEDMQPIVKNYFKGAGIELTNENLKDFLGKNEKLKSQRTNQVTQPTKTVKIGDKPSDDPKNDIDYAEFKKLSGIYY